MKIIFLVFLLFLAGCTIPETVVQSELETATETHPDGSISHYKIINGEFVLVDFEPAE